MICNYNILPEFYQAFRWCEKNNIRIYPVVKNSKYLICREDGYCVNFKGKYIAGKVVTSGKLYSKNEYDDAIKQYYIYLWKKHSHGGN